MTLKRIQPKSGFTLVELLVVIGIIILVVGVSLPAISVFMRGKSLEGAGQTVQTVFMLARREAVTKKVKHRVIFFAKTIAGSTSYGLKIYRTQTPYDDAKGIPGESAGGYLGHEYMLPESVVPEVYYTDKTTNTSDPKPHTPGNLPDEKTILKDKDGTSPGLQGKVELEKNGSITFGPGYMDIPSFDLEQVLEDGANIGVNTKADIIVTQKASNKKCFIDIIPGVGRVYTKVLVAK